MADTVLHAGEVRTRLYPAPGEVWLRDGDEAPVIITAITWGRVSFIVPCAPQSLDDKPYRESYVGSEYFFAEEWTRLWPLAGRRNQSDTKLEVGKHWAPATEIPDDFGPA